MKGVNAPHIKATSEDSGSRVREAARALSRVWQRVCAVQGPTVKGPCSIQDSNVQCCRRLGGLSPTGIDQMRFPQTRWWTAAEGAPTVRWQSATGRTERAGSALKPVNCY